MRLIGGRQSHQGRLEVQYNDRWVIVANSGFDRQDADVACRQLGYNQSAAVYRRGRGTRFTSFYGVNCNGLETSLGQCHYSNSICYGCNNYYVGLSCAVTDLCKYEMLLC